MLIKGADGRAVEQLEGKLKVLASTFSRLHEESLLGNLFVASTVAQAPSLTGTAARESLLVLVNNVNNMDLVIDQIHVGSAASCPFILRRNCILGALGAQVAGVAGSLNFGINNVPNVLIAVWNEVAGGITGITGGVDIHSILNGVAEHNEFSEGGLIIPTGRNIVIDKGAIATEVSVNITFSMQPAGLLTPS